MSGSAAIRALVVDERTFAELLVPLAEGLASRVGSYRSTTTRSSAEPAWVESDYGGQEQS